VRGNQEDGWTKAGSTFVNMTRVLPKSKLGHLLDQSDGQQSDSWVVIFLFVSVQGRGGMEPLTACIIGGGTT